MSKDHRIAEYQQQKDFDGRPSVDLFEDDPLLTRLLEIHGEPRVDLYPGLTRGVKSHA
jgi:hypothetical protein